MIFARSVLAAALLFLPLLTGCSSCPRVAGTPFRMGSDSFGYANELAWNYNFTERGQVRATRNAESSGFTHHCFPMVRAARGFLYHADFRADVPRTNEQGYRRLIEEIVGRRSRCVSAPAEKLVIPGFKNLREFSAVHENLLKESCGSAARSYAQRGNWRFIFPFTRAGQERVAAKLRRKIERGELPIVHVGDFPTLTINHGLLLFAVREAEGELVFSAYDPNSPERAAELRFDGEERSFVFERNHYFAGGKVNVYEVYRNLFF